MCGLRLQTSRLSETGAVVVAAEFFVPAREQVVVAGLRRADPTSTEICQRFYLVVHNAPCTTGHRIEQCFSSASALAIRHLLFFLSSMMVSCPLAIHDDALDGKASSSVMDNSKSYIFFGSCQDAVVLRQVIRFEEKETSPAKEQANCRWG